jgi:hypothetical protein
VQLIKGEWDGGTTWRHEKLTQHALFVLKRVTLSHHSVTHASGWVQLREWQLTEGLCFLSLVLQAKEVLQPYLGSDGYYLLRPSSDSKGGIICSICVT